MSIWQTKSWQEMLKKSGQVSSFFEVWEIFVEKRKLSLWEYGLFILWVSKNQFSKDLILELKKICKIENCLFIQIEILDYENIESMENLKSLINFRETHILFNKWYYKKFITAYSALINLEKSEKEILEDMKPKWRYNIKLAQKKWIEVSVVEKTDENIKFYYELMCETTTRDNFSWNNFNYYKIFLKSLNNSKLILAKKGWVVIAGWIFIFDDDVSIYYYWASTSKKEYRNMMAPYLVQWEAIKYAKNIWSKIYDFLWVSSPGNSNDSLSWVTNFKKKLSWNIKQVSTSYIFINKKIKYFVINILRSLKN